MDQVSPRPDSLHDRLRRAAAEADAVGDRSAPWLHAMADQAQSNEELMQRLEQIAARQEQPTEAMLTAEQVGVIARMVSRDTDARVRQFARASSWRSWALSLTALVVAAAIGAEAVYLMRTPVPTMTCSPSQGGVACWYWLTPPPEPKGGPTQR